MTEQPKLTVAAARDSGRIIDINPYYVRRGKNGWEHCNRADAEAICKYNQHYAVGDEPLALGHVIDAEGHETDEIRYAPHVVLYNVPDGSFTVDLIHQGDEHTVQITDLEAAAMEIADNVDMAASGTEAALMEIGDMLADLAEQNGGI